MIHLRFMGKEIGLGVFLAAILALIPMTEVKAQSDLSGVYFGGYSGGDAVSGQFGVMLRQDRTAIFAMDVLFVKISSDGSVESTEVAFLNETVPVASNGTFSVSNIDGQGTKVSGQFNKSGLSGTIVESKGANASFFGTQAPNTGFLLKAGGYYQGPLSGTETINGTPAVKFSGTFSVIVAADGNGFAFSERRGGGRTLKDGFNVMVERDFSVSGRIGFVDYEGALDPVKKTANGTFSGDINLGGDVIGQSGTWSVSRLEPLPNRKPVAADDNYRSLGSRPLSISAADGVLANDSDPDGQPLSARLSNAPAVGLLDLRADGSFDYTPPRSFKGIVTFGYRASDGISQSTEATVYIEVLPSSLSHVLPILLQD